MSSATATAEPIANRTTTSFGLALSLFSMLIIRQLFRAISLEPGAGLTLARETCFFATARQRLPNGRGAEANGAQGHFLVDFVGNILPALFS